MGYLINYKKQKYIYIHIPKTGGTTIEHIFDEYINSSNSTKTLTGHLSLMLDWSYDGQKHVDHFIKIEELSMKSLNSIGLDIHYTHTKRTIMT